MSNDFRGKGGVGENTLNPCSVARRPSTMPTRVDLDIHVMTLDCDGVVRIYARGMPGKPPKLIARLLPETARVFAKTILGTEKGDN